MKRYEHCATRLENRGNHPDILVGEDLDESSLLFRPPAQVVPRQASDYASMLTLLLHTGKRILLVDPHFDPQKPRFRNVIEAIADMVFSPISREKEPQLELHTSIERFGASNEQEETRCIRSLLDAMQKHLPRVIPIGGFLRVVIWRKRAGGEKSHNRFVMTDRAGVQFGIGLDESDEWRESDDDPGETEDIHRLMDDEYTTRWAQYAGSTPAFDLIEELIITGCAGVGSTRS